MSDYAPMRRQTTQAGRSEIRTLRDAGHSQPEIARRTGSSERTIRRVLSNPYHGTTQMGRPKVLASRQITSLGNTWRRLDTANDGAVTLGRIKAASKMATGDFSDSTLRRGLADAGKKMEEKAPIKWKTPQVVSPPFVVAPCPVAAPHVQPNLALLLHRSPSCPPSRRPRAPNGAKT